MKIFRNFLLGLLPVLFITPLVAESQSGDCGAVVQAALEATNNVCSDTNRNQACYGHVRLEAIPQSEETSFKFNEVGDRVDVSRVSSLRLSPLDIQSDVWGVALLRLQADIPDQLPDENVTLLVFGDVEVKNAVPEAKIVEATVKGPSNANIRRQPSNRAFVIGSVPPGDSLRVKGQSEDGAWLYVEFSGTDGHGWVRRSLLKSENDMTNLNTIDPALTAYGPMQAFYLENGSNQTTCNSAPNDGILIQTPEGVAHVRLWINEVKIKLGSTAFIQASPDQKKMVVNTLEGSASVEALGVEQVAVAGTSVTVRLDENLVPVAPPSLPQAYDMAEVEQLPVDNLERDITVAAPVEETYTPTTTETPAITNTVEVTQSEQATLTATTVETFTALPATATAVDIFTFTPAANGSATVVPTHSASLTNTAAPVTPNPTEGHASTSAPTEALPTTAGSPVATTTGVTSGQSGQFTSGSTTPVQNTPLPTTPGSTVTTVANGQLGQVFGATNTPALLGSATANVSATP